MLTAGDYVDLDSANALSLRLLPTLEAPAVRLASTTANYEHLCCEQTAAKILSAVVMYLMAEKPETKRQAERIVRIGIEREKQMITSDRGLRMYPDSTIPLLLIDEPRGQQRFALCVRNMFQEERASSPPDLRIG